MRRPNKPDKKCQVALDAVLKAMETLKKAK